MIVDSANIKRIVQNSIFLNDMAVFSNVDSCALELTSYPHFRPIMNITCVLQRCILESAAILAYILEFVFR